MKATTYQRRDILLAAGTVIIGPLIRLRAQSSGGQMYGLISKINAVDRQRDALAAILL